jgi:hypothetical protein
MIVPRCKVPKKATSVFPTDTARIGRRAAAKASVCTVSSTLCVESDIILQRRASTN